MQHNQKRKSTNLKLSNEDIQSYSFKYHIHPIIKLSIFISFNLLAFSSSFKHLRWIILLIECVFAFLVRLPWRIMNGFFKVLILNFLSIFLIFYFATKEWKSALILFGNFAVTILIMIIASFLFTHATPPIELITELRKVRIPAKYILAIVIAISWLPLLTQEVQKIIVIQKSRGYKINLFKPGPIAIPALLRIMDFSINLSISLESRGFS
ncbi:MAG: energy-coupling factor transporter transmembrane protein EcfT [Candidatus Lokiarchaeota archaeon]|nr:energy-coupling factor transporter transmembrane protein EcfT [Candidatus Harpocratesius repetitus]